MYRVWWEMKARCTNEDHPDYHLYGGRGIKVSPAWVSSFDAFRTDMGAKPNGTTIDREDNNGDYTKKNCRWATHSEQANNKRTTVWIEALGKRLTLRGWETELSIPYKTLRSRHQMGWEAHRIVTTPHKEAA